jgi:hypothetical protein
MDLLVLGSLSDPSTRIAHLGVLLVTVGLNYTREKRKRQRPSPNGGLIVDRTTNNDNYYDLACKTSDFRAVCTVLWRVHVLNR